MDHGFSRPLELLEILEPPKQSSDILDKNTLEFEKL